MIGKLSSAGAIVGLGLSSSAKAKADVNPDQEAVVVNTFTGCSSGLGGLGSASEGFASMDAMFNEKFGQIKLNGLLSSEPEPDTVFCKGSNKRTKVSMDMQLSKDQYPVIPAFKSRLVGSLKGDGLEDDTMFGMFLKDGCGGDGYQTHAIGVAAPRDFIFMAGSMTASTGNVMNNGDPLWLELQNNDGDLLACCQF